MSNEVNATTDRGVVLRFFWMFGVDFSKFIALMRVKMKKTPLSWTARPKTRVERSNAAEHESNFGRRMTRDADQQPMRN